MMRLGRNIIQKEWGAMIRKITEAMKNPPWVLGRASQRHPSDFTTCPSFGKTNQL